MFVIFIATDNVELQSFEVKTFAYLFVIPDRLCSAHGIRSKEMADTAPGSAFYIKPRVSTHASV
jgi:hypothetical protein